MFQAHFLHRSTPRCTRIVNQDVDPPKLPDRRFYNRTDLLRISDIAAKRQRLHSGLPQLLGRLLAALFLPRAEHHCGSHFGQALGHLPPQPYRASRDNGHAACKVKKLLRIHKLTLQPCSRPRAPQRTSSDAPLSHERSNSHSSASPPNGRRYALGLKSTKAGKVGTIAACVVAKMLKAGPVESAAVFKVEASTSGHLPVSKRANSVCTATMVSASVKVQCPARATNVRRR